MIPHSARRTRAALVLLIALVGVVAACAAPGASQQVGVAISDAWVRPAAAGSETAAYLTITNPGGADRLVAVRCSIAASTMFHQTETMSGMTGMTMLSDVPVPAGATVKLEPGGTHVMMTGLGKALEAGTSIELRLTFEHAGEVVVDAAVRPS